MHGEHRALHAILWVFLLAWVAGCAKALPPTLVPDAQIPYHTADGWQSSLRHYPGSGPPVLLVHGMGVNHYNWDFRPEISLSHALQREGFDVWVVELRGDPGSVAPSRRARRSITFDDHAQHDLPAAVDRILELTGHDQLFWVGHSMGGMLLYAYLAEHPERIAAGVAICSPVTFLDRLPLHKTGLAFSWAVGGRGRIPARALVSLTRPLGRANPVLRRVGNFDNLDWPTLLGLARYAVHPQPKPLLKQAALWVRSEALVDVDGEPYFLPADIPLQTFGAPNDKIVSHHDVAHTCSLYPDCDYTLLSKDNGFMHDYGHIDPVVGLSAATEVYPLVIEFLQRHSEAFDPPSEAAPEPQR